MKYFRFILCFLFLIEISAAAQTTNKITASVTITNATTDGLTFTLNGDTRTFKTTVANPATQVLLSADVTGNTSKTNLLAQIYATRFSSVRAEDTGSNSFNLVGNADLAMALSVSGAYASISYSTQLVADVIGLQGPVSALPTAVARTNNASDIAGALNAVENTNSIHQTSLAASELMGTTNTQIIQGIKKLTNAASQFFGTISNSPAINGTVIALIGGLYTTPVIASPTTTNLVNYGNAISSPGTSINSEQFGSSATATGANSLAVGVGASAAGDGAVAIGPNAYAPTNSGESANMAIGGDSQATRNRAMAVGNGAIADADSALAIGFEAEADAPSSQAIGVNSIATHTNSTAIGVGAATTAANQIVLGGSGINTVIQNNLSVLGNSTVSGNLSITGNVTLAGAQTNSTLVGTNNFLANSDIAFTRKSVSSLANGGNSAVPVGTNVFFEVSGPTGAFSIDGIANGRDGKMIILLNQTSQQITIKNESGTDPTAANRIRTLGAAADLVLTNSACTFIYSGSASRWILISHNP